MIGIICDSGTDAPLDFKKNDFLEIIPLKVILNEKVYLDGVDFKEEEIISFMTNDFPKTSLPSIPEVRNIFNKIIARGYDEIIVINISNQLSGTHNICKMVAREILEENRNIKIELIDSLSISMGSGLLVAKCIEMVKEGLDFKSIANRIRSYVPYCNKVYFTIPTLKFLKAGGRIGKVSGTIGEMLNIKPIISVGDDGVYYTAAKIRNLSKAIQKTKQIVLEDLKNKEIEYLAICFSGNKPSTLNEVERLKEDLDIIKNKKTFIVKINPTLLVHTGEELIGIAYLLKK